MANPTNLTGQWIGHFVYGPEYGEEIYGEKVEFRFFITEFSDGQFEGTAVDVEGFGTNMNDSCSP